MIGTGNNKDSDLGVFLDANHDYIPQVSEFIKYDGNPTSDEKVELVVPATGMYIICLAGFDFSGAKESTYNWENKKTVISSAATIYPTSMPTGQIKPNEKGNFLVAWKDIVTEGVNKGAFVPLWMPNYGYVTTEERLTHEADRIKQEDFYRELFPGIWSRVWKRVPELVVYRALVFLSLYKSPGREGLLYMAYHAQQLVLFGLFVCGVWLTRRQWRRVFPVYLAYFLLGVVVPLGLGGLPRWRIPVEPFIIVFACAWVVRIAEK
jgi:hypothetical protein